MGYAIEISTAVDVATVTERSAALAEDVFASLGRALLDRLGRGEAVEETPSAERGGAGPPNAVVGVAVAGTGRGPCVQRWRPDTIARQLQRLRKGALETLTLGYGVLDADGWAHGPKLRVDVSTYPDIEGLGSSFAVQVSASWPGAAGLVEDWAPAFLARAVAELEADSGYVTFDDPFLETPYETWCGWGFAQGLQNTATTLRGYYWANFLTAGHVERLGGANAIRAALPGSAVEPLAHGLLVRLPGTPSTVRWADRLALYELFRPLLLEPRPRFSPFPREHR